MNESFGTFERAANPSFALAYADRILGGLGLSLKLETAGAGLKTTAACLSDGMGRHYRGSGKGIGAQSTASAVYEAFEHWVYAREVLHEKVTLKNLDLSGSDRGLANGSPDLALLCGNNTVAFSRLVCARLKGDGEPLELPAFLTNPDFSPTCNAERDALQAYRLMRYSTNSGTAAGHTHDDAALHGLLEVIERDAVGIELLRTVIRRNPAAARRIEPSSLPLAAQELCELAREEASGGSLALWDITTDIGVPVILAGLRPDLPDGPFYFGSGASLSGLYALERAVLESVQTLHLHKLYGLPSSRSSGSPDGLSLYARCFLAGGRFAYRNGEVPAKPLAGQVLSDVLPLTPEQQLRVLEEKLNQVGATPYFRSLASDPIHVVQVVVPQLERFHLVSYGIPVAPGARGRAALEASGMTQRP